LPTTTLAKTPPTLVITDERDVLRSQGEEFAKRLEAAGATVTATRYEASCTSSSGRPPCWTRPRRRSGRQRTTS